MVKVKIPLKTFVATVIVEPIISEKEETTFCPIWVKTRLILVQSIWIFPNSCWILGKLFPRSWIQICSWLRNAGVFPMSVSKVCRSSGITWKMIATINPKIKTIVKIRHNGRRMCFHVLESAYFRLTPAKSRVSIAFIGTLATKANARPKRKGLNILKIHQKTSEA